MAFLISFFIMLVVTIAVVAVQSVVIFAGMYLIHKFWEPTEYGEFDFDHLDKAALQRTLLKLLIAVGPATLLMHLIYFVLTYFMLISRAGTAIAVLVLLMFLVQAAAAYVGTWKFFELKPAKAAALAGMNLLYYLFAFYVLGVERLILG